MKLKKIVLGLTLIALLLTGKSGASANTISPNNPNENTDVIKSAENVYTDEITLNSIPLNDDSQTLFSKSRAKRIIVKRGSILAWSKDYVEWVYNGSKITYSTGWQEAGWIFPNIVRTRGIVKYYSSSSLHKYRAKKTISGGTPTPWGDFTLYSRDFTDYISVWKDGKWSVN